MRAIDCPISPDFLRHLVHGEKLTDAEIAGQVPGGTAKRVRSWRRRFKIATLPRWERHEVPPIEGRLQSLLVGSMLGDGRIVHRTHAAHYSESHCGAQKPYLEWKAALWGPWATPISDVPDKRGYKQVRMNTVAHGSLVSWQGMFYPSRTKGWKRLLPRVVDLVDDFALAIWYLDDGSADWWPTITFGMDDASWLIANAIFEKFGIHPRWNVKKGKTGQFHMEREDTAHKFIEIIRPHIPECMGYKLEGFGFQGPHYQVRQKLPDDLREMAAMGVPIKRIARDLGIGASTVDRWLTKLGISHPRKIGRPLIFACTQTSGGVVTK